MMFVGFFQDRVLFKLHEKSSFYVNLFLLIFLCKFKANIFVIVLVNAS